ncbi:MAG: hypothetical protein ACK4NN_15730 [Rheinheimera sp.]
MNQSSMLSQERDLANLLLQALWQFKLWIGVFALAGALGAVVALKYLPKTGVAKASFTLADARVQELAKVYQDLPANTQLMLGALEIDELARFSLLLQHPHVWQQLWSGTKLCQSNTGFCAQNDPEKSKTLSQNWRPGFQSEHKRRGNILSVQWRNADAKSAGLLLEALLDSAAVEYQQQRLLQLSQQRDALQSALASINSIGERSELSRRLDPILADIHLWQQGPQQILHPVLPLQIQAAKAKPVLFSAIVGALLGALLGMLLALVFLRR